MNEEGKTIHEVPKHHTLENLHSENREGNENNGFRSRSASVVSDPENDPNKSEIAKFLIWTSMPRYRWTPQHFLTCVRGTEYLHIYLWIIKDLAWTQDLYILGIVFGTFALAVSLFLTTRAVQFKNWIELWHYIAQFLWLFGNFWWMYGELHDHRFPNEEHIVDVNGAQCGWINLGALCWLCLYYIVFLPFKWFPHVPDESLLPFDDLDIKMPKWFKVFQSLRSVENLHTLFLAREGYGMGKVHFWCMDTFCNSNSFSGVVFGDS